MNGRCLYCRGAPANGAGYRVKMIAAGGAVYVFFYRFRQIQAGVQAMALENNIRALLVKRLALIPAVVLRR